MTETKGEYSKITWQDVTVKIGTLKPWEGNPKTSTKKDARALLKSWDELGQFQTIAIGPDGDVYDGHQRLSALMVVYGSEYQVAARVSSRPLTDEERRKIAIYSRQIGAWDWDILSSWQPAELMEWGFDGDLLKDWKRDTAALSNFLASEEMLGVEKDAKPNPRKLPIDAIYTAGTIGKTAIQEPTCTMLHCCIAVSSGFLYGVQSSGSGGVCATSLHQKKHLPQFIDNDFYNYDHALHLASVKKWKPKYATVCDIMTPEQCAEAKIEYRELAQILDWAEELAQHAQNVIVIPKYDCLDKIPDKFMLGYSVPTSHGGTPLPVKSFKGRRVHLLGGSWKAQLAHMAELGDDVVSLDNNYIYKMSTFGSFVYPDGQTGHVKEDMNLPLAINPLFLAIAASVGNIAAKINELYSGNGKPADNSEKDKTE